MQVITAPHTNTATSFIYLIKWLPPNVFCGRLVDLPDQKQHVGMEGLPEVIKQSNER